MLFRMLLTALAVLLGLAEGSARAYEPGTASTPMSSPSSVLCPACTTSIAVADDSTTNVPCGDTVTPGGSVTSGVKSTYLHNGEFYTTQVDMRITGRGLDVIWGRKYRAQLAPFTAQGNGWDFSYNVYLQQAGPDLLLHDGNTREDVYFYEPPPGENSWSAPEFFREITQDPGDGSFTMLFTDRGKWHFFPFDGSPWQGKLDWIEDRNGNQIVLQYDLGGRLETIWDTLGRPVDLAYNADGFIQMVTDFTGRQVTYEYYGVGDPEGSFGDLKSVTTPIVVGTPHGNDFPLGKTTTYTYTTGFGDAALNHNLLTIRNPRGDVYVQNIYAHTVAPSDPRYTLNPGDLHYDRLVRQEWGEGLIDVTYVDQIPGPGNNFAVVKAIVNDRMGNVEEVFFDGFNRSVVRQEYTGRAQPDQPTSDTVNRPVGQLRPGDPAFFETRYEHDANGLVSFILHPNGNEEQFVYDAANPDPRLRGNLLEHCRLPGPLGGDQPQICEQFEYESGFGGGCCSGFVSRHVDARGFETLHDYDAAGNRTQTQHRIPSIVEDWEYNGFGQLTAHVLPDNGSGHRRRDEFTYYTVGPQTGYLHEETVDALGLALITTYEYDDVGNVVRTVDPRGNDTLYVYNELDQLVQELAREVDLPAGLTRYEKLTYYDANNNVVRRDVENLDEQGFPQPNSFWSTINEYDVLNRLTRVCQEKDDVGLLPTDLDCTAFPVGTAVITEFVYDPNGNQVLRVEGEAAIGNQPDNLTEMLYDERDLLFQEIRAPFSPHQSVTQYDYDGNGNQAWLIEGLGSVPPRITQNLLDGYDRVVSTIDPMGNVTTLHYDANSNVESARLDGELLDVPGGVGNVRLSETFYVYDEMDRRIIVDDAFFDVATQLPIDDGWSTTMFGYSDNSQLIDTLDDNGWPTVTTYDTANRVATIIDPLGNEVSYTYDANSNIVLMTELEKSDLGGPDEIYSSTYTYDGLDRRIRTDDNIGVIIEEQRFDSRDNLTLYIDADGYENRYSYDGLVRRLEYIRDGDGDGADGDGDDVVVLQAWDDSSRLVGQQDGKGNLTTYEYDPLNRLTRTVAADGTEEVETYDVHGNVINSTLANGTIVTYIHDALDRVVDKQIVPGPGVMGTTFEIYEYDGESRTVGAHNDFSTVLRGYDSTGNVTSETLHGQVTTYEYDGVGNRISRAYPSGRQVTYTYDSLNRIAQIADAGGTIAEYDYVGPGRVARRTYGNGTQTDYTYDGIAPNPPSDFGVKQVIRTLHTITAGGAVIDDRTYTWDARGNKTQRQDTRADGPELTHDYAYDPISRLTRGTVTDGGGLTQRDSVYTYDQAGNRLTVVGHPNGGTYTMDATLPEPADLQVNQYTTTPAGRRIYDARGNLVRVAAPGDCDGNGLVDWDDYSGLAGCLVGPAGLLPAGCSCYDFDQDLDVDHRDVAQFQHAFAGATPTGVDYVYDYLNRLVVRQDASSFAFSAYTYDALGRRIETLVDAGGVPEVRRFFYDDWQVIEEQDDLSVLQATYVYGNYIDEVLNMQRGGGDYYYHTDDQYNVVAITDAAAAVVERYEYDDFGRPLSTSLVDNPYLFTGRRYDTDSGLYHYRQRYYDSVEGRFLTRDPIGIWGDPVNLGAPTTYVGNNPWSYRDAYGDITIKRFSFKKKTCGGINVKWVFSLDKKSKCEGYIVQQIDHDSSIAPCGGAAKKMKKQFWEAWKIKKGEKVSWDTKRDKWTDSSIKPSRPNTCGKWSSKGTVKFFCVKKTGDLGDLNKKPKKPNDGWGPGAAPWSGVLPSTKQKPKWWGKPSDGGEKPARRASGAEWDCCVNPPKNNVWARP
jgi:RHS repeat-associated protein